MTQETCLLLKTKDKRYFPTSEKHLDTLTEFAKTFRVEVFLVELKEKTRILGLKRLANAVCDQNQNYEVEHKKIKRIFPAKKRSRQEILQNAAKIERFVMSRFKSGKELSLKELKDKYKNCNLTDAALCQHMSRIRRKLARKGNTFEKVRAGDLPHDNMTLEELRSKWDQELSIDHNAPPISDEQILEWLMEDEKRAVKVDPDCPPYDPKTGL